MYREYIQSIMKLFFFFFFYLLSFLLLRFSSCSAHSDIVALLKIKSSMVALNGSSALADWQFSASPSAHCSFSGVSCDHAFRVVSLNVSSVPLFGTIPPEIGLLDRLQNLTLAGLNLAGRLPTEMTNLTSVKFFNLSNNLLEGDLPGKIILAMPELQVFDVYNNNFNGSLPIGFANLKFLRHLCLGGNYFTGEIPECYGEIQSLEYLGVNGNSLTGKSPAFLSRLKNLRELYVGYFNIYTGGVPPEFGNLSQLRVLDMGNCSLTGEIPASLGNLKQLHSLFLQLNHLTGTIPGEFSGLLSLEGLDLSINELTGEIPVSFSTLQNISLMNLFSNHLNGPIPSFVIDFPQLEVLQVWSNNFTDKLPENLGRNGKLRILDVSTNHLTGPIPRNLCRGGLLQNLILMDNFFFGHLPEEIGQCKSLRKIRIMKNLLDGAFPSGIFRLPQLSFLEMNDNYFSGELPSTMSGDNLQEMKLHNNRLSGRIPSAIGNFKNLQFLSLESNRFSGKIPDELFSIKPLLKVNIGGNDITGVIPKSIADATLLTMIDLSRNHLIGEIPESITKLRVLSVLNLSGNNLSGKIPEKMKFMTSLCTLDLSNNNLVGRIPSGGQFLAFNGTSFTGNPLLGAPLLATCPRNQRMALATTKLIITTIPLTFVVLLLLTITVTTYMMRMKGPNKSPAWKLTAFQRLTFKAEDVVDCLKEENIIGTGGAGIVYRGSMPGGGDVAIKLLVCRGTGRKSDRGFSAEIETLGRIKHRNIVRLLGYVSNRDTRSNLLLYEYMPNGSLGGLLHGPQGCHLQWERRYKIAVEAARGLCYLHHDCSPLIIHWDVKSYNILLDSDFEAHVADFGLAKLFLRDTGVSEHMSCIAGSFGYLAPEYAYTLKVDEKIDVYRFGVVLLELITGKKPVGEFEEGMNIVLWVKKTISELPQTISVLAIVDPRLSGYPLTAVVHMFRVAMMCVQKLSSARPTMRKVVQMLTDPLRSAH